MKEYWNRAEATAETVIGGWLHTGDVAVIDEMANIEIRDRIKDVIKTGGEWISSLELESLLTRHPAVSECAVIAIPDAKWGERPLALVVLKPEQQASADELRAHLRDFAEQGHISRWAVPEHIRFVDALARTSVGKLNKRALREQFVQQSQG